MEEKEKYRAEIEARLLKMGETLHQIKLEQEKRRESLPHVPLAHIIQKHEDAHAKLVEIEEIEESKWHRFKSELENLINDIDDDLRKALAYFG